MICFYNHFYSVEFLVSKKGIGYLIIYGNLTSDDLISRILDSNSSKYKPPPARLSKSSFIVNPLVIYSVNLSFTHFLKFVPIFERTRKPMQQSYQSYNKLHYSLYHHLQLFGISEQLTIVFYH